MRPDIFTEMFIQTQIILLDGGKGKRWDNWCQLLQVEEADKLIQNKSGRTKRQLMRVL